MNSERARDWQDLLGDSHPMVRGAAAHLLSFAPASVRDDEALHALLGETPKQPIVRAAWRRLFDDLRARIASIVIHEFDRHQFVQSMILRHLMRAGSEHRSAAMADHFRALFLSPRGRHTAGYASEWRFPDGMNVPQDWIVFREGEAPVAVADIQYGAYGKHFSAIQTMQGVKGKSAGLESAADTIMRSWEPLESAGIPLLVREDQTTAEYPIYGALAARYCSDDVVQQRGHTYRLVDATKRDVRELFNQAGRKERNRHREYMFE